MYAQNETVATIKRGFELVPNRVAAAAFFNYYPPLSDQRLSAELGWGNYLANAALREMTQGEGADPFADIRNYWEWSPYAEWSPEQEAGKSLLHDGGE